MMLRFPAAWFLVLLAVAPASPAQRAGYPPSEFAARRSALMEKTGRGIILLFGETLPTPGVRFRQDNDFYYYTGVEQLNAVLMMVPDREAAMLFLPAQDPREIAMDGANLLSDRAAAGRLGFQAVLPLGRLDEMLAGAGSNGKGCAIWSRLSPPDTIDGARYEMRILLARRDALHYNAGEPVWAHRTRDLRERFPECRFEDLAPLIDDQRVLKSPAEIAVYRRNGALTAEAVKQAMRAGGPGCFEYEVEAVAVGLITARGARSAFPPIVASGPNAGTGHYENNGRKMAMGEMVNFDFGADMGYLCTDITRTWPVSGKFSKKQRAVYERVLASLTAAIAAFKPGATWESVHKETRKALAAKGLSMDGVEPVGHFIGMSVHDGGRRQPLKEGMVLAVEPWFFDENDASTSVRIEDTVLITKDGCEVLTAGAPKTVAEVEAWLAGK